MKNITKIAAVVLLLGVFSSCTKGDKWKKDSKKDKAQYYYSTDFKQSNQAILGLDVKTIDVLYSTFFYEGKVLKYKMVAEKYADKKSEVLAYEEGVADVNKDLHITFKPQSTSSYTGHFENDKKNYKVSILGEEHGELNFILKK